VANVVSLSSSAFSSGTSQAVSLPAVSTAAIVGQSVSGSIWVAYGSTSAATSGTTAFGSLAGSPSYVQIATLTVKST
jgi:hypothetical protein